jgi:splicing factor 45
MSFAPPANLNDESTPPPPPPADITDDPTGEDAYMRRLRLSQTDNVQPTPPPPPPPTSADAGLPGQISRNPVRYNLPAAPEDIPETETELADKLTGQEDVSSEQLDQPRSSRPGQAGFAERLMSKYGWSKGQGLGAQGTGIINPLYAKADKRKKKSDAEGGGFATPATTGKILGGNKSKAARAEEEGKFGAMSEVVRLDGMLNGLDVEEELSRDEGGILQEIGDECGTKYGSVQRVYIHRPETEDEQPLVFVSFVSQLSALRAVNALEGRIFNGNPIKARFWPKDKFDDGDYL